MKSGKLTKAEIASLLQASQHEPRSLLGYHEFARAEGTPLAMVRVFEPGAESVAVFWEDEIDHAHELKRVHEAGVFEGGIPYRRPLVPYRLRVGFPGTGQGSPLRTHLITSGFAWAASSYRCNGYVPGRGLLDSIALTDLVAKQTGKAPARVYLTGASMGGHITILGLQEFPTAFAGGLAMCPAGPGEMDFLTSVREVSELISGVKVTSATRDTDVARLTEILGKPPEYTPKGRQLASVQILLSGGFQPQQRATSVSIPRGWRRASGRTGAGRPGGSRGARQGRLRSLREIALRGGHIEGL